MSNYTYFDTDECDWDTQFTNLVSEVDQYKLELYKDNRFDCANMDNLYLSNTTYAKESVMFGI